MEKSKLVDILRTFKPKEWQLFLDYLASPYFNKDEALLSWGKYLHQCYQDGFPSERLDRKRAWKDIYRQLPFHEKTFFYRCSQLNKLAERFLGLQSQLANDTAQQLHILRACQARQLEKSYRHHHQSISKRFVENEQQGDAQFWQSQIHFF